MPKKTVGADGLPAAGSKNPRGFLNFPLLPEHWDMVKELQLLWGTERQMNLSIKDVVVACIIREHHRMSQSFMTTTKPAGNKQETPAPTPLEVFEGKVKDEPAPVAQVAELVGGIGQMPDAPKAGKIKPAQVRNTRPASRQKQNGK